MSGTKPKSPPSNLQEQKNELDNINNSVITEAKNLQKLSRNFAEKGTFGLFCDSKIPEKDKSWWKFCSLEVTDCDYVLKKLKNYQKFYENLSEVVCTSKEKRDTDCEKFRKMIDDLYKELLEMTDEMKREENTTPSSTLYKFNKSFVDEHEKLVNLIKRTKLVILEDENKKNLKTISILEERVKSSSKEIVKIRENLKEVGEKFSNQEQQNKKLIESNRRMRENQEMLMESIENMKQERSSEREEANQRQKVLLDQIEQMRQERSLDADIFKNQQEEMLRCIREMKHQQDILIRENADMKMKLETTSSHPNSSE